MDTIGAFVLIVSVRDGDGRVAASLLELGKSIEEWDASPLVSLSGIALSLNQSSYRIGESVSFAIHVIFFFVSISTMLSLIVFVKSDTFFFVCMLRFFNFVI